MNAKPANEYFRELRRFFVEKVAELESARSATDTEPAGQYARYDQMLQHLRNVVAQLDAMLETAEQRGPEYYDDVRTGWYMAQGLYDGISTCLLGCGMAAVLQDQVKHRVSYDRREMKKADHREEKYRQWQMKAAEIRSETDNLSHNAVALMVHKHFRATAWDGAVRTIRNHI